MKLFRTLLTYAGIGFLLLLMIAPVLSAVLGSVRTTGEFLAAPFGLPSEGLRWENYTSILSSAAFWRALGNSVLITLAVTILVVLLSSMLAFVFARMEFRGKGVWFNILSIGMLFPLVVAILPVFIQIRELKLINSYWGVILPIVTFSLPGSTIILRGFFRSIPRELEDAAYIDGCTTVRFFWHILLPLARPGLAAVATITVVAAWNDYLLALLVLNDAEKWPLPLGIMQFQGQYGTDWAKVMAFVTLLIIPAVAFYIFTEKYLITGLTGGELKG
ncbi:MAG TPA: carbohydrate ABC transporter permease [Herpetosiphonaceae bacterium]|nr:carbohydrate ABC transporter permease [Herpetosiphonaceae bacterium]